MRKHFLILMLMALLPFTGWAASGIDYSAWTLAISQPDVEYTGTAINLSDVTVKLTQTGQTDVVLTAAEGYSIVWTKGSTDVTQATELGTYTVTVGAGTTGNNLPAANTASFQITPMANACTTQPGEVNDVVYGTAITAPSAGTFTHGTGTIKYARSATATEWTTTAPTTVNSDDPDGKWYYKSVVAAADNYAAAESQVNSFVIAPRIITYFITGTTYNVGDVLDVTNHYSLASGEFLAGESLDQYAQFKFYASDVPVDNTNHLTTKGSYTVSALRVVWNDGKAHNYDFRFTSSGKIIVAAKSIENFVPGDLTGTYTFDGSKKTPTAPKLYPTQADKDNDKNALELGVDYTVSYGANTNAGDAQIIYTASEDQSCNYDGEVTLTFQIQKINITADDFNEPTAKQNLSYNKTEKDLINLGEFKALDAVGLAMGTFEYQLEGSTEWIAISPKAINAGTYPVKWRIKGGTNYNNYSVPDANDPVNNPAVSEWTINASIAKAMLVIQPKQEVKALYKENTAPDVTGVQLSYTKFYGDDALVDVFGTNTFPHVVLAQEVVDAHYAQDTYDDGLNVEYGAVLPTSNYAVYPINGKLTIEAAKVKVMLKGGATGWNESDSYGTTKTEWDLLASEKAKLQTILQTGFDENYDPVYTSTTNPTELNIVDATTVLKTTNATTANPSKFSGLKVYRTDAATNVGPHPVSIKLAEPINDNYDIVEQTAETGDNAPVFTITAQNVIVNATNKAKVYGSNDPDLTFTSTGTLTTEQKGIIQAAMQRVAGENVNVYEINFKKGISEGNGPKFDGLSITYNVGAFAITPKTLTITANPQTLYSGNAVSKLDGEDYEVEGLVKNTTVNGETLNDEANVTLALDKTVVYEFTSYPTAESTNPYATGTVEVVSFDATNHTTTLKVLTNVPANANVQNANEFIDQQYIIHADPTQFNATTAYQLYNGTTAMPIYVKGISQVSGVYVDATATTNTLNIPGEYKKAIKATLTNADALSANYDINIVYGKLTVIDSNSILVLDATANNGEAIEAADTKTVNVTFKNRILKANTWYTMVLPFSVKTTELVNVLKAGAGTQADPRHSVYAITNRMTSVSEGKINFTLEMLDIPANEPFLIKTAEDVNMAANDVVFENKEIEYDDAIIEIDGEKFIGTYAPLPLANTDNEWYGFLGNKDMKGSDGVTPLQNRWYNARLAGLVINSTEAYLQYAEAHAPMVTIEDFDFETGTTAIKTLNAETMEAYNVDGWYTLNGIKLQSMPTEKGVYINNGKKVVIK